MKNCGVSLRTITFITLCFNVLINVCTLLRRNKFQHDSAYTRIMGSQSEFAINVILNCVEIVVYCAAIEALRKKKTFALDLTFFLAFLNSLVSVFLVFKLLRAENAANAIKQEARFEMEQFFGYFDPKFEYLYTIGELAMCIVWAICLIFHFSSAAILYYTFRIQLKESSIAQGPVSDHKCANLDPPPRYTVSPIEFYSPPSCNNYI